MKINKLNTFYLVGGTCLSLRYGHRKSIDLDQKKDFWDIAELLQHYTLQDFIDYYCEKYPSHQLLISIPQALTYFSDADESEDPVSLKVQTWASVQTIIKQHVNDYLK